MATIVGSSEVLPARARRLAPAGGPLPFAAGLLALGLVVAAAPASVSAQQRQQLDRFEAECGSHEVVEEHGEGISRLSDQCRVLAEIPPRPRPLIELGEAFLGTGTLHKGIRLPGGAVWQPALLLFGTLRGAVQGGQFNPGQVELGEAVSRLDLFANLYLTQTERILVGIRPLDRDGRFTGYTFTDPPVNEAGEEERFTEELNAVVRTLFFEGDLGEILPNLDNDDSSLLDIYFSVGRQPLNFGDGMLINDDALDMVGITRANMKPGSVVNFRWTGVFAWNEINRPSGLGNIRDDDASLFGLFTETDLRSTTIQFDAAYVMSSDSMGDGIHLGLGDIRRWGRANNTIRILASLPIGDETPFNTRGFLIHEMFSWTPVHSHDFWWVSAFAGIDRFRSATRGPATGGPIGATGVLFGGPGIGRVGAALGSAADDAIGAAIGRQFFLNDTRSQLVFEVGGRTSIDPDVVGGDFAGFGARFQSAIGRRMVFGVDGATTWNFENSEASVVGRLELAIQM